MKRENMFVTNSENKWIICYSCDIPRYFSMIFRTPFSKHLSFLTPLDGFFSNVVSNYVKSRQHFQIPVFEPEFFQVLVVYKKSV